MKNLKSIVFGILLIGLGAVLALKALDIISFNIFFEGWWTLLFIIPSIVGLFTERDKAGNVIVLVVFSLIFLSSQNFINSDMVWKLALPIAVVAFGVSIIFSSLKKKKQVVSHDKAPSDGEIRESFAAFSGTDVKLDGEKFEGAKLTAVFGGIKYDLRGAVIEDGCEIRLSAIFGGIDVIVPEGVNVKSNVMGLFGGASDKTAKTEGAPTVYISGECVFGGAEIKQ